MKILVGTSGYGYKEWKGKFYPDKIPPREMLRFYAERLSTVEINNTFYRMPNEEILLTWAAQVPDDFVFALKAPQVISHRKRLRDVSSETEYFFRTLSVLGRKLGPVLFQFPPSFRADRTRLHDFFDLVPGGMAAAFEFRHPSWLEEEIFDLLRSRGFSLCIADIDENPAEEIIATAAWGYLRLRRADYPEAALSRWLDMILAQNWDQALVFFKHEEKAIGPEAALRFRELAESRV